MTEFGQRVEENSAFGTDHNRRSVMFVIGGGLKGRRVLGKWPSLSREVLEGPSDLPMTTPIHFAAFSKDHAGNTATSADRTIV